jgi:hypothetical protein
MSELINRRFAGMGTRCKVTLNDAVRKITLNRLYEKNRILSKRILRTN